MLQGRSIVCFSSIDWGGLWQGHQEIMSRLAAAGNRVLFVEHTGTRRPGLRDTPRLAARLGHWMRPGGAAVPPPPNVTVLSPLALPLPYNRVAVAINTVAVGRQLRRAIRRAAIRDPIAWVFLPTPLVLKLLPLVKPSVTVYHNVDDFASASPEARRIQPSEETLLREADLVFVTSERLRLRAAGLNRNVHLFRSGVNIDRFEMAARAHGDDLPADIRGLKKPVIGYVGGIHQWVDLDLVSAAARAMPEATFVLIGPSSVDVSRLKSISNVVMLGAKRHQDLPSYVGEFDVALIPYRRTPYTEHVFPAKLNEYLSMGKPVVATAIPEIVWFVREHGPVAALADDADQFISAIRQALSEPVSAPTVEHRRRVARASDWQARVEDMSSRIQHI